MMNPAESVVDVTDLGVIFDTPYGMVKALTNIDLTIKRQEIVCLVGESGCGKSTLGLSLIGLLPSPPARIVKGKVMFKGTDVAGLNGKSLRLLRGTEVFMIFQEPMTSLNPILSIEDQLTEAVGVRHESERAGSSSKSSSYSKKEIWEELVASLESVKISDPEIVLRGYPHQLSGGMRQRIMISMALLLKPSLLIADEPTTALDVTTQDQILKLLKELVVSKLNTSILFITHDLTLAKSFAQRVVVMYAGEIVEQGETDSVLKHSKHPYTQGLLSCLPKIHKKQGTLDTIPGSVPDLVNLPLGCKFHDRCGFVMPKCLQSIPGFFPAEDGEDVSSGHSVRCFLYGE
jgi:peptide/nickel transport system ATP-binding protein